MSTLIDFVELKHVFRHIYAECCTCIMDPPSHFCNSLSILTCMRPLCERERSIPKEVNALLGMPDNVETFALIPIGYPIGKFGPVARLSVEAVTFQDRWGQKLGG